jgi:hypothetical protein
VISGWLIKIVVGIALAAVLLLELGSPLIARAQADDAAHEVTDDVVFALKNTFTQAALDDACATTATTKHVKILRCEYNKDTDVTTVTVEKAARSILLYRFGPTKDWYKVHATASAKVHA